MSPIAPSMLCLTLAVAAFLLRRMSRDQPEMSRFFMRMSVYLVFAGIFFLAFLIKP